MKAAIKRKLQTRILLALSALIISYIFYGLFHEKFNAWDSRIIDRLFVLQTDVNPVKKHPADAVVHIDANLYFSRPQHAQIIRNLADMAVSAQLVDFIFADQISEADDQPLVDATRLAGNVYYGLDFERLSKESDTEPASSPAGSGQQSESDRWQILLEGNPRRFWIGTNPRSTAGGGFCSRPS